VTGQITTLVFVTVACAVASASLIVSSRRMRARLRLRKRLGQLAIQGGEEANLERKNALDESSELGRVLAQSGLDWDLPTFLGRAAMAAGGGLALGLVMGSAPMGAVLSLFGAVGVWLFIRHARSRRLNQCNEQMPQALEIMSLALRAGHALPSAIALAAEEAPSPIADELRRAADEQALGRPVEQVLEAMGKRLPGCDSVNTFVVAVLVLQETGGNLISVIDRIVDNARSAASYRGRLNALTSEGRTSAKLLAALPVGFALLAGSADTGYADFFLSDSTGRALGVFALLWWLTGILFTRRLVKAAS